MFNARLVLMTICTVPQKIPIGRWFRRRKSHPSIGLKCCEELCYSARLVHYSLIFFVSNCSIGLAHSCGGTQRVALSFIEFNMFLSHI
jgi:hypothetical protein